MDGAIDILVPSSALGDTRRLSACIIGAADETGNMAHEVVSSVEQQLLDGGWLVGAPLGALREVQKGLGIGRPVFREAITILETRGMIDVRRGPGGGLFVSAPKIEDVIRAMLMYLALTDTHQECVAEFRLVVWRMIVEAAYQEGIRGLEPGFEPGQWGFAHDLAVRIGNNAMVAAAHLSEMLVRICEGSAAPARDVLLETALGSRNLDAALGRLDTLAGGAPLTTPIVALEAAEQRLSGAKKKSAMMLAARLTREMGQNPGNLEAEWETAERLGYSGLVVRQARRILQDFGVVRCHRGKKGAQPGAPVSPGGVIRLLAPYLIASGVRSCDHGDAAFFLASSAPELAAQRTRQGRAMAIKPLPTPTQSADLVDVFRVENLLLELSGNPLLAIMLRSLALANKLREDDLLHPAVCAEISAFNSRILGAIAEGDAPKARALAQSKARVMRGSGDRIRKLA